MASPSPRACDFKHPETHEVGHRGESVELCFWIGDSGYLNPLEARKADKLLDHRRAIDSVSCEKEDFLQERGGLV